MLRYRLFVTLLAFIAFIPLAVAQGTTRPIQNLRDFDDGVKYYEGQDYVNADKSFRLVLQKVKILPDEISYYFGSTSYYLGKYKQSINWLNKYIELAGTRGQFFDEAVMELDKAEDKYREQRENEIRFILDELSDEPQLNCQEHDKIICPVCKGEGVIIKEAAFGKTYITCPYSNERGLLSCNDYNLLIRGELKPKQ